MDFETDVWRNPIAPLLPEWERLYRSDPEATPFSSPTWARAWWPHWAGSARPWIVTARHDSRLVALAALILRRRGPFRVACELGRNPSNYWTILCEPAVRRDGTRAIVEEIVQHSTEWDALTVTGLSTGSATEAALADSGLHVSRRAPVPHPGIELPDNFDQYLQRLPRRRRKELRRQLRRIDENELELRRVVDAPELRRSIETWQELRTKWWKARRRAMNREHSRARFKHFLQDLVELQVPTGEAQVTQLLLNGRVVCVDVSLTDDRTFYSWLSSLDPDAANLSLGSTVITATIRSSIAAARRYYDLMVGAEHYKYSFGATDRYCRWLMLTCDRPRSLAARPSAALAGLVRSR